MDGSSAPLTLPAPRGPFPRRPSPVRAVLRLAQDVRTRTVMADASVGVQVHYAQHIRELARLVTHYPVRGGIHPVVAAAAELRDAALDAIAYHDEAAAWDQHAAAYADACAAAERRAGL